MYDPKSLKAEEFIDHQEVLDTLAYAESNKNNEQLISSLIEKAKLRKGCLLYTSIWVIRLIRRKLNHWNRLKI